MNFNPYLGFCFVIFCRLFKINPLYIYIYIYIWKSELTDKTKGSFFQAAIVSILLYGCTTWTLTKRLEKKLDGNYTRMLGAILNKSWRQHSTRHQLAKAGRPARTYIQQLCEDTGCSPEDLPEAMNDKEKWRERVRDIRATSTTC